MKRLKKFIKKYLTKDVKHFLSVISTLIVIFSFLFGIYKFYFEQIITPEKAEKELIMHAYINVNSAIQELNAFCKDNQNLSTKQKVKTKYDEKIQQYNDKILSQLIELSKVGKNIYSHFNSRAHDTMVCYIKENWARANSHDSCHWPLKNVEELDEQQKVFFDELSFSKSSPYKEKHSLSDKALHCSSN